MQQYFGKDKKNNTLYLKESDLNHIQRVMRMKENDEIIVVYDEKSYVCSLNNDLLSCEIKSVFKDNKEETKFLVYVPFLQDEKMSYIFKHGTELGITDFVVVEYERCKYKLPKKDYEKKQLDFSSPPNLLKHECISTEIRRAERKGHRTSVQ